MDTSFPTLAPLRQAAAAPSAGSQDEFDRMDAYWRAANYLSVGHQMFTRDEQIVFAFHGYPGLIHRLTYRRTNRTFTCTATGKRARSPRNSTCVCRTNWTASIW